MTEILELLYKAQKLGISYKIINASEYYVIEFEMNWHSDNKKDYSSESIFIGHQGEEITFKNNNWTIEDLIKTFDQKIYEKNGRSHNCHT